MAIFVKIVDADLVPQENAFAWLRYLRHTAPTIPFRSSTQQQSANLKSRSAPGLLNLIKSYRNGPASKITVGVVGYPNVGKSSLINSLKRSKVQYYQGAARNLSHSYRSALLERKQDGHEICKVYKSTAGSV